MGIPNWGTGRIWHTARGRPRSGAPRRRAIGSAAGAGGSGTPGLTETNVSKSQRVGCKHL